MDLDPRDYDLGELRGSDASDTESEPADRVESSVERTRKESEARTNSDTEDVPERVADVGRQTRDRSRTPRANALRDSKPTARRRPSHRRSAHASIGRSPDRFRELATIERTLENVEKPYLQTLPSSFTDELRVFEWLGSLLATIGRKGTIEALRYYRELDWITEPVESDLRDRLIGLEAPSETPAVSLHVDDHLDSLILIARLAAARGKE